MKEEIPVMEYNRVMLKQAARQSMKLQRPHPMLITLLFNIIANLGAQFVSGILGAVSGSNALNALFLEDLIEYEDPSIALQYVLLSFTPQRLMLALFVGVFAASVITSLWTALMRTGYAGFCLGMVRGQQPQTGALFGFFPRFADVLVTQFLAGLFRTLWALLLGLGLVAVVFAATFITTLLSFEFEVLSMLILLVLLTAAYIAFFLGLIWITLRYAMVDYVIVDQGLFGMAAIQESKQLMRGNTGKLFTLELSFAGWYLLEAAVITVAVAIGTAFGIGLFSSDFSYPTVAVAGTALGFVALISVATIAIGVLNLWLTPYITGSEALFYDWARGARTSPSGGWGQPQYPGQPPRSPRDDPWG